MGSCQSMGNGTQIVHPGNFDGVQIISKTWKKTFSNLYDYTAQLNSLEIHMYNVTADTRMIKKAGKYEMLPYMNRDKASLDNVEAVIDFVESTEKKRINEEDKLFSIFSKQSKTKQQPWVVVKSLPSHRYVIKEGDMLRIGKQKVRVKEIIEKCEEVKEQEETITAEGLVYENLTREGKPLVVSEQQAANYLCKFCLDSGQIGNPLMAPCSCAGSSKYVHLKCVQMWLTKTINPRTVGRATVITWKPLICELCHKNLPFKVYLDGKRYFTVNIPKPRKPYLVLNPIYRQKDTGKAKIYYLVSFAEHREMIIGRKTDSDILFSDDSTVSRHHSKIVFEQTKKDSGHFLLYDNQSKFGTLVMLRKFFTMRNELSGLSLQLGGDLLQLRFGKASLNPDKNLEELINKSQSDSSDDHDEQQEEQIGNEIMGEELNEVQPSPATSAPNQ